MALFEIARFVDNHIVSPSSLIVSVEANGSDHDVPATVNDTWGSLPERRIVAPNTLCGTHSDDERILRCESASSCLSSTSIILLC